MNCVIVAAEICESPAVSPDGDLCIEKFIYFSFFKANVPRVKVMTLRNGDDTIILEVTGSPPVIKRNLMIILGLSLEGCESEVNWIPILAR